MVFSLSSQAKGELRSREKVFALNCFLPEPSTVIGGVWAQRNRRVEKCMRVCTPAARVHTGSTCTQTAKSDWETRDASR